MIVLMSPTINDDVEKLMAKGVEFIKPITKEIYGYRAQFKDLYGNLWEIVQYDVFTR
jgi:uncharacterized glyoxalase superfamily protein PhnB